jgi:peptide/nickel transport system ATP-binding protein
MLQIKNVSKIYTKGRGTFAAVDDVSFTVGDGEVFALVGESGSGKSTLAQMVMRLVKPTSGTIQFTGQNIFKPRKNWDYHRMAQMVFQNPDSSLNPRMTVEELITEPLIINRVSLDNRKKTLRELLDKVQLSSNLVKRLPSELSGGQKQRVAIARSLVLEPRFLIADEVTSALDALIEQRVIDLLKNLHRETGISILFITHNLEIARSFADRVGVMQQGNLIEVGHTGNIFAEPQTAYTKQLIEAIPISHPRYRHSKILEEGRL